MHCIVILRIKLCLLFPEIGETSKSVSVADHFLKAEQDLELIVKEGTMLTYSLNITKAV